MAHPFELDQAELAEQLENMVQTTMSDLKSEFLEVPKGEGFIEYPDFRDAFEDLKRQTENFTDFTVTTVHHAVRTNSRILEPVMDLVGLGDGQTNRSPQAVSDRCQ